MALRSRFLLQSIFHTFIVPLMLCWLLIRCFAPPIQLSRAIRATLYLTSVPLCELIASVRTGRKRATQARELGARPIPRIKGYLPGNIDILWELVTSGKKEYCSDTLRKWSITYGPTYDLNILWAHQIVTSDPANFKQILATGFGAFEKGEKFRDMFNFMESSIFTADADEWKFHRNIARPFFTKDRITDFDCFERHTADLIDVLKMKSQKGQAVDFQDLFARFTLDTTTDFLFGSGTKTLRAPEDDSTNPYTKFADAVKEMQEVVVTRVRIGSTWPLFELWKDKSIAPKVAIDAFIDPIIDEALTQAASGGSTQDDVFVHHLIRSRMKGGRVNPQDFQLIRDALLALLFAGRDAVGALLTFALYCLILHPQAMETLRSEIKETLQDSRLPNAADIREMKYLRAVLNETMRLFAPVPNHIRRSVRPTTLPSPLSNGPLYMQERISVTYSFFLMQRRKDVWGEDAEEFNPDRWLGTGSKTHITEPFAFIPFNAGPRICLGQALAYQESSYLLIRLLQRFRDFEFASDTQPPPPKEWASGDGRQATERIWVKADLNLYIQGGLWLRTRPVHE